MDIIIEKLQEPEKQGVSCDVVCPRNFRSCTLQVSPTEMMKPDMKKDCTNRHADGDGGGEAGGSAGGPNSRPMCN